MKERTAKLGTSTWMLMQSFRGAWQRLSVALLLVMLTMTTAWAQSTFGGGSGTQSDPYKIATVEHLRQLSDDVNDGNTYQDTYFVQTRDIDFEGADFTPIGGKQYTQPGELGPTTGYRPFYGNYDGQDHRISNVNITAPESFYGTGLFGYTVSATIQRVHLMGTSTVTAPAIGGGIVGLVGGEVEVLHCEVGPDVTVQVDVSGSHLGSAFGGIAGVIEKSGKVMYCTSAATVSGNGSTKANMLGGIVGYVSNANGHVVHCHALGQVIGGVSEVGDFIGANNGIISLSYYHSSNPRGAVNGADDPSVFWVGTITMGNDVEGTVNTLPTLTYLGKNYYREGERIGLTLTYTGDAGEEYAKDFTASAGTLVPQGSGYNLQMPGSDVTINVTLTSISGIGDGSGTQADPFIIRTTDDMDALAERVNGGQSQNGIYYRLAANLDYTGKTYTPVGKEYQKPFMGHFDGQHFTISHVTLNDGLGLFGNVSNGSVRNVTLSSSSVGGGASTGAIVCYLNGGEVDGCIVQEDVTVSGDFNVGGIVGYSENGSTISYCTNNGNVSSSGSSIGGIVGLSAKNSVIIGCFNSGEVWTSKNTCGGIVGYLSANTVEWCVNEGAVTANNYAGGIVGDGYNSTIDNCLNMAALTANSCKGGITASNGSSMTLTNNYYAGACTDGGVQGSDRAGAMRGWKVTADESIHIDLFPDDEGNFTGFTYDGIRYLGAGETSYIMISRGYEFSGYTPTVSAGTLTAVEGEDDMYTLTMPSTGRNVNISLAGTLTLDLLDDDSDDWYNNTRRLEYNPGFTGSVKLAGRTLHKDGKWNTLCLPFDVLLEGSPLEGATARPLTAATITGTTLNLTFGDAVSTLVAGTPYMINWKGGDDIVNPVFQGVTLDATDRSVSIGLDSSSGGSISFNGTYGVMTFDAADPSILLFGGDKLHYGDSGDNLGACRAYFLVTPAGSLTDYVMNFGNGETLTGSFVERGDANADGSISVTDIAVVVNCILQLDNNGGFSEYGADANGDGQVTVTDIGVIVDKILGSPTPTPPEGGEPQ